MSKKLYLVVYEETWEGGYKWGTTVYGAIFSDKEKAEEEAKKHDGEIIELELDSEEYKAIWGITEYMD